MLKCKHITFFCCCQITITSPNIPILIMRYCVLREQFHKVKVPSLFMGEPLCLLKWALFMGYLKRIKPNGLLNKAQLEQDKKWSQQLMIPLPLILLNQQI